MTKRASYYKKFAKDRTTRKSLRVYCVQNDISPEEVTEQALALYFNKSSSFHDFFLEI